MKKIILTITLIIISIVNVSAQKYIKVSQQNIDFGSAKINNYGTPIKVNIAIVDPDDSNSTATGKMEGGENSVFKTYTSTFYPQKEEASIPVTFYFKPLEKKSYSDKYIITYKDESVELSLTGNGLDEKNPYDLDDSNPITSLKTNFDDINWSSDWKKIQLAGSQTWDTAPWGADKPYAHFCAKKEDITPNEESRAKLIHCKPIDCSNLNIRKAILSIQVVNPKEKSGIIIYLADKEDNPSNRHEILSMTGQNISDEIQKEFIQKEIEIPEEIQGINYLYFEGWGINNDEGDTDWRITDLRFGLDKLNPTLNIANQEYFCGNTKVGSDDEGQAYIKVTVKDMPDNNSNVGLKIEGGKESPFSCSQTSLYFWNETDPAYVTINFKAKKAGISEDNLILTFAGKEYKVKLKGNGLNSENPYDVDKNNALELSKIMPNLNKDNWKTYALSGMNSFTEMDDNQTKCLGFDTKGSYNQKDIAILISPIFDVEAIKGKKLSIQLKVTKHNEDELIPDIKCCMIGINDNKDENKKILEISEYPFEKIEDAKDYLSEEFVTKEFILNDELLPSKKFALIKIYVETYPLMSKTAVWKVGECAIDNLTSTDQVSGNKAKLSVVDNNVLINTENNTKVSVYNINGVLMYETLSKGETTFTLPHGIYVIKIGNQSSKVVIK